MKKLYILFAVALGGCATPSLDRNTKWVFDIPQRDIEFIFLPSNLTAVVNGAPSTPTEVEATYNMSAEAGGGFVYLDPSLTFSSKSGSKGSEGTSIKIKTRVPPFRTISDVAIDVYESVPSEYIFKSSGRINRGQFSDFLSAAVTKKYNELRRMAMDKGGNAVVVTQQNTFLEERGFEPKYGIYIKASIVQKVSLPTIDAQE